MTAVTVKLTASELRLLTTLASDQLFRREFIDPKMPGHQANPDEVRLGKKLVERLQRIVERANGARFSRAHGATA